MSNVPRIMHPLTIHAPVVTFGLKEHQARQNTASNGVKERDKPAAARMRFGMNPAFPKINAKIRHDGSIRLRPILVENGEKFTQFLERYDYLHYLE